MLIDILKMKLNNSFEYGIPLPTGGGGVYNILKGEIIQKCSKNKCTEKTKNIVMRH